MLHLPVVSLAAEHLVLGLLLRRNILTYKAPPGHEGYDLICMQPDPKTRSKKVLRIQVKSRYRSGCGRGVPIKRESIKCFDYLAVVFLNIGRRDKIDGSLYAKPPEYFFIPSKIVDKFHNDRSSWQKFDFKGLGRNIEKYAGQQGLEKIASNLRVPHPLTGLE